MSPLEFRLGSYPACSGVKFSREDEGKAPKLQDRFKVIALKVRGSMSDDVTLSSPCVPLLFGPFDTGDPKGFTPVEEGPAS